MQLPLDTLKTLKLRSVNGFLVDIKADILNKYLNEIKEFIPKPES